jgi:hypothetical protein
MVDAAYTVCRVLTIMSGCLFIWAAIFLKIDEERRVHRTIEGWRNRLGAWPNTTQAKRERWLFIATSISRSVLDSLFGAKFLSIRSTAVSANLAALSVAVTLCALSLFERELPPWQLVAGVAALVVATAAAAQPRLTRYSLILLMLIIVWLMSDALLSGTLSLTFGSFLACLLVAGATSNFVVVAAIRRVLPLIQKRPTLTRVTALLFGTLTVVALLVALSAAVGVAFGVTLFKDALKSQNTFAIGLGALAMLACGFIMATSNLSAVACGAMVSIVALALIVDGVLWAALERPVYAAARFKIISQKKTLLIVGAALIASAMPTIGGRLHSLVNLVVH